MLTASVVYGWYIIVTVLGRGQGQKLLVQFHYNILTCLLAVKEFFKS